MLRPPFSAVIPVDDEVRETLTFLRARHPGWGEPDFHACAARLSTLTKRLREIQGSFPGSLGREVRPSGGRTTGGRGAV